MQNSKSILSKLSPEQKKKAEEAASPEALSALAKEAGMELTPDQLEGVTGGTGYCYRDFSCAMQQAPKPQGVI